jgi:hypothetical protein
MFRIGLLIVLASNAFGERRIVVENEFARVLDVTESGTVKGRPHEHAMNRVMIYLTPGKQQLEYAGGEKRVLEFQAGTPLWSAAGGVHTSQNLGGPFRVIEVELNKKPGPAAPPLMLDPVKVAPRNYKVEFDEPQARVIRARIDGKQQVPMHEHGPNRVVVFLTDAHLRVIDDSGVSSELKVESGTVRWSGSARHREENLSPAPFEVIAVELK